MYIHKIANSEKALCRWENKIPKPPIIEQMNQLSWLHLNGLMPVKNWFNQACYDRTERKYGKKGIVDFYKVQKVNNFTNAPSQNNQCWSVLIRSNSPLSANITTKGILKEIFLTSSTDEKYYLTIWKYKSLAEDFFKGKGLRSEYFDSPIFIDNSK